VTEARSSFHLSEMRRMMENLFQFGVVKQVSPDGTEATVEIGEDLETSMLPILQRRAGADSEKWALSPGEQVFLVCPSGEMDSGVIVGSIHQKSTIPSGKGNIRTYSNGVSLSEEYEDKRHQICLKASDVNLSYQIESSHFDLSIKGSKIQLKMKEKPMSIEVTGENASISIDEKGVLSYDGQKVLLGGSNDPADGVITGRCICPLTGIPHAPASTFVLAKLAPGP